MGTSAALPIQNNSIHAPTAVLFNAGIAALGALAFAIESRRDGGRTWALPVSIGLAVLLTAVGIANLSARFVDIQWIKGGRNWPGGLYEKWNALSRIHVRQNDSQPFALGFAQV